jgi:hypothetical protein
LDKSLPTLCDRDDALAFVDRNAERTTGRIDDSLVAFIFAWIVTPLEKVIDARLVSDERLRAPESSGYFVYEDAKLASGSRRSETDTH